MAIWTYILETGSKAAEQPTAIYTRQRRRTFQDVTEKAGLKLENSAGTRKTIVPYFL